MARNRKRFEKICTCCNKVYEYCSTCSDFDHMERWHDAYCSKNCKELYNVLAGFLNNWLPPEVEAARLSELDLSYKNKLQPWMKDAIAQLQKVDTSAAKAINAALKEDVNAEEKQEEKPKEELKAIANQAVEENIEPKEVIHEEKKSQTATTQRSSIPKEFKRVDYSKKKNDYKKQ